MNLIVFVFFAEAIGKQIMGGWRRALSGVQTKFPTILVRCDE
jgi:hypothetical protein